MKEELLRMLPVPSFLHPSAIGLSIENDGVALVSSPVPEAEHDARFVSLPVGVVDRGEVQDQEEFKRALKTVTRGIKKNDIVLSLPSDAGFLVRLEVDSQVGDIDEAVLLSIDQYIPINPSELVISVEKLGISKEGKQRVLVNAYPETLSSFYEEAVLEFGFNPVASEMSIRSMTKALIPYGGLNSSLLLRIGRERSQAVVVVGGRPWLFSTIAFGWNKIVQTIARAGQVKEEEAMRLVYTHGFTKTRNKEVFDLMIPAAAAMRDEIVKIVRFWDSHKERTWGRARGIDTVIITGKGAGIPGFAKHLSVGLPVRVTSGSPFDEVAYTSEKIPIIKRGESFEVTAAYGAFKRAQERVW
jgi:Tfp pilus assembly PilM family ATPase